MYSSTRPFRIQLYSYNRRKRRQREREKPRKSFTGDVGSERARSDTYDEVDHGGVDSIGEYCVSEMKGRSGVMVNVGGPYDG